MSGTAILGQILQPCLILLHTKEKRKLRFLRYNMEIVIPLCKRCNKNKIPAYCFIFLKVLA